MPVIYAHKGKNSKGNATLFIAKKLPDNPQASLWATDDDGDAIASFLLVNLPPGTNSRIFDLMQLARIEEEIKGEGLG